MIPPNEKMIEDFKNMIRIHHLKMSLFHTMEQLKHEFKSKIEAYREIERVIDPGNKQEKTKESVKEMEFVVEKVDQNWIISIPGNPDDIKIIPPEILEHITCSNVKPGGFQVIKNFTTKTGKIVNFSFEKQAGDYFTCLIAEKCSENEKGTKQEIPSKEGRNTEKKADKKEDLKTLLNYLSNHEIFFNTINEQFIEKWKPILDKGLIANTIEG
jgi:hypothetical protein